MNGLLIVDDEAAIRHAFRKAFHAPDYAVQEAVSIQDALKLLGQSKPDVIVLDLNLPDAAGLDGFDRLKQRDARVPIVLITGHGTTDLAIEAIKRGAYDYLLKPVEYSKLHDVVSRACASSRLMTVPALLSESTEVTDKMEGDALIGRCPSMQEVYKAIGRVASTDETVLILGESGTGKELIARAIYQHSQRKDKPFVAINCGAIPDSLIESELFGHEKGAFTGAERRRIGKFEQCTGGTLLLDEIGEMKVSAQVKLLRVLQERCFERVGGTDTIHVDVRVIAATNADLDRRMAAGQFRSDLFYRLNVFSIRVPPLRDRGDDLDLLTDYCIQRFAQEIKREVPIIPQETRLLLHKYHWPGNVRELQSVLKQAVLQMSGTVLLPEFLPVLIGVPAFEEAVPVSSFDWNRFIAERLESGSRDIYDECLAVMERHLLPRVLQHTGGNQLRAAELLGITRSTLRQKLRSLNITVERSSVISHEEPE
jgi:DNA-binding NtrC family response regulator